MTHRPPASCPAPEYSSVRFGTSQLTMELDRDVIRFVKLMTCTHIVASNSGTEYPDILMRVSVVAQAHIQRAIRELESPTPTEILFLKCKEWSEYLSVFTDHRPETTRRVSDIFRREWETARRDLHTADLKSVRDAAYRYGEMRIRAAEICGTTNQVISDMRAKNAFITLYDV